MSNFLEGDFLNDYKEVYYHCYCCKCKYKNVPEDQDPCNQCLTEFVNLHSHKPINFKQKEDKSNGKRRKNSYA